MGLSQYSGMSDGYLIIDLRLDFSELVDKGKGLVCTLMMIILYGSFIFCADKWPESYPENVERIGHVYASTSGQDIGASTSGGRTVEDNEDGDEDEDEDKDGRGVESSDDEYVPSDEDSDDDTDSESSSSVLYIFDDITGWEKTLEEVDSNGIKIWDGNPDGSHVHRYCLEHVKANLVGHFRKEKLGGNCQMIGSAMQKTRYLAEWQKLEEKNDKANIDMIQKCQNILPSKPMKLYEEARKKSMRQQVNRFSKRNQKYEVVTIAPDNQPWKAEEKQVVLYADRECTWGCWQTTGFPCSHALRVARELGDDPFPLFDPCYTTQQWWSREKKVQGITRFNLAAYRDQLAVLAESDFVWMPYTTLLGHIARVCLVGHGIWQSQTWLICGDVVAPHNPSRVFRQSGYHQRIPGDALLPTAREITRLLKRKSFGGSDRRWIQQLRIYLQVWNDHHGRLVGTDDDYVGEPTADPEYLLWYHQVTVKYVTDPTDSENTRGFHGSAETLRLMATLMEDVHSLSIIGQRTFDKDSFGYDRLGEIAQVAERRCLSMQQMFSSHQSPHHSSPIQQAFYHPIMSPQHQQSHFACTQFSSPQTSQPQFGDPFIDFSGIQQSSLDDQSIHYTNNFLSSMFKGVAGQYQADDPAGGERESQGEDDDKDEAEDANQQDQFEGQGYHRHEEQGSSQTLGTPPLAVSKDQRVIKEPDRLTYSHFRAKKLKKK
ncbi:OLC1v1004877C1 [Oldenlandia corymbosa var. corymbosa]|uniref:OLC1v1004877C1 n=1 Tax=Oldenlandia corymbosa var. corymbosa TaxID=529605 RepID=A0AAV1DDK2_OLDCO|nr:OLC1v1004877C1 [Oldenlandia corymbosa var. corymbosa]